jgi:DUF1365 family protein
MTASSGSAIYAGHVAHARFRPVQHRLRYKVFSLLLDIDRLDELDRRLRLFAHNHWAPLSLHDKDHGPCDGGALRPWVEARLADAGIDIANGAVRLLCYPRMFGYVFNPLSVFFCHRPDGALAATLYEVSNTFGEKHTYVLPANDVPGRVVRQSADKAFHVSPFLPMSSRYHFRVCPPGEQVRVVIRQEDQEGLLLAASFAGERAALTDAGLMAALVRHPLMTLKIIGGIHWEALRIWLKGAPIYTYQPAGKAVAFSVPKKSDVEVTTP